MAPPQAATDVSSGKDWLMNSGTLQLILQQIAMLSIMQMPQPKGQ